jgi:hypothetical protein
MAKYTNFYETVHEVQMRLRGTLIMYGEYLCTVLGVSSHVGDGVFRLYVEKVGQGEYGLSFNQPHGPPINNYSSDDPVLGVEMDKWLAKNPNSSVMCVLMNDPLLNRFRPFPLGMCNSNGLVYYLERTPTRKTEQGLTGNMIMANVVSGDPLGLKMSGRGYDLYGPAFLAAVTGKHPSAAECLQALLNPAVENNAAAFDRHFAFVRGPLGLVFLAYKTDIVGVMPKKDLTLLQLDSKWLHLAESIYLLNVFENIERM